MKNFSKRKRLNKRQVEECLRQICQKISDQYNEGEDYWEINANGFYVNILKKKVEFEFTVMNDKFWDEVPFDIIKEKHGLDIELYQDYFKN